MIPSMPSGTSHLELPVVLGQFPHLRLQPLALLQQLLHLRVVQRGAHRLGRRRRCQGPFRLGRVQHGGGFVARIHIILQTQTTSVKCSLTWGRVGDVNHPQRLVWRLRSLKRRAGTSLSENRWGFDLDGSL